MVLISPAFEEGKSIPSKYAHGGVVGGNNVSVPLKWKEVPTGVKSFALSIVDPHPVAKNWIHWFVVDIPIDITSFAEGVSGKRMPAGCRELFNSYGELGYGGPEPPKGSGPHPYVHTLYALSIDRLDVTANSTLGAFTKALAGHVIATASLTAIYER